MSDLPTGKPAYGESESVAKQALQVVERHLEDKKEMPLGPDTPLASAIVFVSGLVAGAAIVGFLGLPVEKGWPLLLILGSAFAGVWVRSRLRRWVGLVGSVVIAALPAGALFWTYFFIGGVKDVQLRSRGAMTTAQVASKILTTLPKVWVPVILIVFVTLFLSRRR